MADVNINDLALVVNSTAQGGVASLDCNGQDIGDVSGTVTRPNQPATKQYVDSSGGITVVDNLTSTSTTDALSANQGRILDGLIPGVIDNLTSTSTTDALSANQGRILEEQIDSIIGATSINNEFVLSVSGGVVFQIPSIIASDAGIAWDLSNNQLRIFNDSPSESLNVNFEAIWNDDDLGYPDTRWLINYTLGTVSSIYFTDTGNIVSGLDLSTTPKNVEYYLRISSTTSNQRITIRAKSMVINESGTLKLTTEGSYVTGSI